MIGMTINMLTGYIDKGEALKLFTYRSPLFLAGVFEPRGIGRADEGGQQFWVSGRWPYATGVHLSDWFCASAAVGTTNGPEVRHFLIPRASIQIHPNWKVMGLCATGSDDVELSSVAVDRRRSFSLGDTPWPEEPFWRISFYTITASLMAAAVLGMARGALDASAIKGAGNATSTKRFGYNSCFQSEMAKAEAMIRAARAFMLECMDEVETAAQHGIPSERQRAMLWLAGIHAVQASVEVIDILFSGEGASGIRLDSSLQRRWRDVHAASKHVVVARQRLDAIGGLLLGAPVDVKPFL